MPAARRDIPPPPEMERQPILPARQTKLRGATRTGCLGMPRLNRCGDYATGRPIYICSGWSGTRLLAAEAATAATCDTAPAAA